MRALRVVIGAWILTALASYSGAAQSRGFGIGIVIGEPTGFSAKAWTSPGNAVDIGVAWAFSRQGYFHLHADYLWHFPDAIRAEERFVPYAGFGGRMGFGEDKARAGIRVPGGIAYWPRSIPLDVFLEIALIMDVAPATELSLNGGIGARYFFP